MVNGFTQSLTGQLKFHIDRPMVIGIIKEKWQMGTWLKEVQASGLYALKEEK
jgi:hypothetical protein